MFNVSSGNTTLHLVFQKEIFVFLILDGQTQLVLLFLKKQRKFSPRTESEVV